MAGTLTVIAVAVQESCDGGGGAGGAGEGAGPGVGGGVNCIQRFNNVPTDLTQREPTEGPAGLFLAKAQCMLVQVGGVRGGAWGCTRCVYVHALVCVCTRVSQVTLTQINEQCSCAHTDFLSPYMKCVEKSFFTLTGCTTPQR